MGVDCGLGVGLFEVLLEWGVCKVYVGVWKKECFLDVGLCVVLVEIDIMNVE